MEDHSSVDGDAEVKSELVKENFIFVRTEKLSLAFPANFLEGIKGGEVFIDGELSWTSKLTQQDVRI